MKGQVIRIDTKRSNNEKKKPERKEWSRGRVECDSGRETEEDNRRGHSGSHLIVHPLAAVQMGRLTPVSSFKSSYNGPQFRWAARKGAILSKVTQFLCSVLLFQPLSAPSGQ